MFSLMNNGMKQGGMVSPILPCIHLEQLIYLSNELAVTLLTTLFDVSKYLKASDAID